MSVDVEVLVAVIKTVFWLVAAGCVVAVFMVPMPREKVAGEPTQTVAAVGGQVWAGGAARPVDPETVPIAVGYHYALAARPASIRSHRAPRWSR